MRNLELTVTVTTRRRLLPLLRKLERDFRRTRGGYRAVLAANDPSELMVRARRIAEALREI
jgi:hypothetical protein